MQNKIDYELEASHILEEHTVEESSEAMARSVDTNRSISWKHNTYELRNAYAALIHSFMREYNAQTELLSAIDDDLVDARAAGSHDKEGIYGFDNPNELMVHKREEIVSNQEFFLDQVLGNLKMFWLRYGKTHLECLLYSKSGKLGYKQTQIAKIASTGWYSALVNLTEEKELVSEFSSQRQQLSYKLNGLIDKLKTATQPPVKQYELMDKLAVSKLVQVEDKQKKLDAILEKQPVVIKEAVNR